MACVADPSVLPTARLRGFARVPECTIVLISGAMFRYSLASDLSVHRFDWFAHCLG